MSNVLSAVRRVVGDARTTIAQAQIEAERTQSPLRTEMQRSRDYLKRIAEVVSTRDALNKQEAEAVMGCVCPVIAKFSLKVEIPSIESCVGTRYASDLVDKTLTQLSHMSDNYK